MSPFCIVVTADIIMNVLFVIAPWGTLIGIKILILIYKKVVFD